MPFKKIVYILGNPIVKQDRYTIFLIEELRKLLPRYRFIHIDPTEELVVDHTKQLIFIDTVINVDQVTIFHDLEAFISSPRVSVHDFDLPLSLGLLLKTGKVKKLTIIGIPVKGRKKRILKEISDALITSGL